MGQGMAYRVAAGLLLCLLILSSAGAEPTTKPAKSAKATTKPTSSPAEDKIVYVGKSGKKYHEEDCAASRNEDSDEIVGGDSEWLRALQQVRNAA
jgi:hypothetical protein